MRTTFTKATLVLLLAVLGCGSDDDKSAKAPPAAQVTTNATSKDPGLTKSMEAEFGAACLVPDSSASFVSSLRIGEQWKLLRKSNAVAMLLDLPTVQMALGELMRSEPWMQLQQAREQMPMAETGLEVLEDAVSQEAFLCLDERWPALVTALSTLYYRNAFATFQGDEMAVFHALVESIVEDAADVRIPGTLLGFRLQDPERAQKLLKQMIDDFPLVPFPIAEEQIGGGTFHTMRLDASMIPVPVRREWNDTLEFAMVPPAGIKQLNAWIDKQTLAIAIGLRDDYLLLSIGADTTQLASLGGENSLAQSPKFAPARRHFKPRVISLSYLCAELTTSGKLPVDTVLSLVDEGLAVLGEAPAGLPERVRNDVAGVIEDINSGLPDAHDELTISYLNQGFESYTFGAVTPSMDASRPLSILASAGPAPLLAIAGRSLSTTNAYARLAHWCGVAYGYFEEFGVPQMSERERTEFHTFEKTFVPALREIHETTANKLIPSVDANEGLFVLSADGVLPMIPGMPPPPRPLRYPRPAMVFGINDAEMLTTAFAEYRETVNTFLAAMAKQDEDLKDMQLPPPESREFAGGKLYTYPMPLPPELKVQPHAVVTKDRALLAIAEDHSAVLLKDSPLPSKEVVDLSLAAGSAVWIDIAGWVGMLFDDAEIVLQMMEGAGELDQQMVDAVTGHFPVARKVLGVMKSYTARTWIEGDTSVTHSWLRMDDAKR